MMRNVKTKPKQMNKYQQDAKAVKNTLKEAQKIILVAKIYKIIK